MTSRHNSRAVLSCFLIVLLSAAAHSASAQTDSTLVARQDVELNTDSLLVASVTHLLAGFEAFRAVDVQVHDRAARLTGTVSNAKQRDQVEKLTAAVPGILFVVNDVDASIVADTSVAPAVERVRSYLKGFVGFLPVVGVALAALLLFWILSAAAGRIRTPFERFGMTPLVSNLMARLLRFIVFVLGVVIALDILGITALVGAILGTAGVIGIAIGFAFQDIIENYLAGLILSVRQPFRLGDLVKVSADQGKVVRLTSRELLLLTLDGNHVSIPNAQVFKSTLYNFTRNPRRRFGFDVGIDVGEELVRVQEIGIGTLSSLAGVLPDPAPSMRVVAIGDSSVQVTFFGWVDQDNADFEKVRSEAIRLVKRALDQANVIMPEPIYNVRMKNVLEFAMPSAPATKPEQERSVAAEAMDADVTVDRGIDEQIEADIAQSDEQSLLKT